MKHFFITGTDTEIGKTFAMCALMQALRDHHVNVVPMKPIAAGSVKIDCVICNEDVHKLLSVYATPLDVRLVNPYCFDAPIAPHVAAKLQEIVISMDVITSAFHVLAATHDVVLVEGAGGFLVPLSDVASMAELPSALGLDVILVVGLRLGCLNHALLTVEAIQSRGLRLAGWIGNVVDPNMSVRAENIATLRAKINAPCLGILPRISTTDVVSAAHESATHLQIESLLG